MEVISLATYALKQADENWGKFKERYKTSKIKKNSEYERNGQPSFTHSKSTESINKVEDNKNKKDEKAPKKRWFPWMKLNAADQERRDEAKKLDITKTIQGFCENKDISTYDYSPDLSSYDRRIVHEVAEQFDLKHESVGTGKKRHIRLEKKPNIDYSKVSCISTQDSNAQDKPDRESLNVDEDSSNATTPESSGAKTRNHDNSAAADGNKRDGNDKNLEPGMSAFKRFQKLNSNMFQQAMTMRDNSKQELTHHNTKSVESSDKDFDALLQGQVVECAETDNNASKSDPRGKPLDINSNSIDKKSKESLVDKNFQDKDRINNNRPISNKEYAGHFSNNVTPYDKSVNSKSDSSVKSKELMSSMEVYDDINNNKPISVKDNERKRELDIISVNSQKDFPLRNNDMEKEITIETNDESFGKVHDKPSKIGKFIKSYKLKQESKETKTGLPSKADSFISKRQNDFDKLLSTFDFDPEKEDLNNNAVEKSNLKPLNKRKNVFSDNDSSSDDEIKEVKPIPKAKKPKKSIFKRNTTQQDRDIYDDDDTVRKISTKPMDDDNQAAIEDIDIYD